MVTGLPAGLYLSALSINCLSNSIMSSGSARTVGGAIPVNFSADGTRTGATAEGINGGADECVYRGSLTFELEAFRLDAGEMDGFAHEAAEAL